MRKLFLISMIVILLFSGLQGQTPNDSLRYYMELAARNNPLVLQRFSEYKAALEKIPQVGNLSDPEFSAGVFIQPMELLEGKQVADFQLMQMFPWFGTLRSAKDEMSQMAKARLEQFRSAQIDIFFEVQRTMYDLYNIRKQKEIAIKNRELLKIIERLTLVRYKSGSTGSSSTGTSPMRTSPSQNGVPASSVQNPSMQAMGGIQSNQSNQNGSTNSPMETAIAGSSLSDLYRIQIEAGELSDYINSLETRQEAVTATFNTFLNRPLRSEVSVMDTLIYDSLAMSVPVIHDSLFRDNPMLGMIRYEENAFDARKKMAGKMSYPMIGIGVDYSLINKSKMSTSEMNGKDMIMPMVKLTLPVYRSKFAALRNEAGYLKDASEYNYQVTLNSLQAEFYQAIQQFKDSKRRIRLYSEQAALANKTLTLMITSLSTSGGNLTDILRTRQQILDYENKSLKATTDYFTSVAWIRKVLASSVQNL